MSGMEPDESSVSWVEEQILYAQWVIWVTTKSHGSDTEDRMTRWNVDEGCAWWKSSTKKTISFQGTIRNLNEPSLCYYFLQGFKSSC